jgi:hypothetical protein
MAHTLYAVGVKHERIPAFTNCKIVSVYDYSSLLLNMKRVLCCIEDQLLILSRSPTLSYTQRLEQKVVQLEAALVAAKGVAHDHRGTNAPTVQGPVSDTQSPAVESTGTVSVKGSESINLNQSISLFQLPDSIRTIAFAEGQVDQETAAKRESLVNNAWRERAYERLADIPVQSASHHV